MKYLMIHLIALLLATIASASEEPRCASYEGQQSCAMDRTQLKIDAAVEKALAAANKKTTSAKAIKQNPSSAKPELKRENSYQTTTVVSPIVIITGKDTAATQEATSSAKKPAIERKVVYRERRKKNAVLVMGGMGPSNARTTIDMTKANVDVSNGPVLGLQYQRSVGNSLLLGATILSNTTATLNLGLEF
jgi:phosphoribosylanthranilate isomerase